MSVYRIHQASQANEVTALIVDRHTMFAQAIRSTLEGYGFRVVVVCRNGADGLRALRRERPDVVLLDIQMDDDGFDVGRQMLEERPESKIIILTKLDEPRVVKDALRVGFHAFLTKETPVADFVDAIFATLEGQTLVPEHSAASVPTIPAARDQRIALIAGQLTPREREVLELLVHGVGGHEISRRLGISPNTVRTHVQSILTKLQVHSRLEAATFAVWNGIVRRPA